MAQSLEEARNAEFQRLVDYQDVLGTEQGKRVFADLQQRWLFPARGKEHAAAGNGLGVAYVDGQRELILTIMNWVMCDPKERVDAMYPLQEEEPTNGESESTTDLTTWTSGD